MEGWSKGGSITILAKRLVTFHIDLQSWSYKPTQMLEEIHYTQVCLNLLHYEVHTNKAECKKCFLHV